MWRRRRTSDFERRVGDGTKDRDDGTRLAPLRGMTPDERAQLVEDIKRSDNLRRGIIERAELSRDFDILAAWEEVEKIDSSINKRMIAARSRR